MDPMPSGGTGQASTESAGATGLKPGLAQEGADPSRAAAMDEAGAAGTSQARGRPRAGAQAPMQAAAAVAHGRLPAIASGPGAGTAARRRQEIAGAVAVLQATTPVGWKRGGRLHKNRTINPMPSGRRDGDGTGSGIAVLVIQRP